MGNLGSLGRICVSCVPAVLTASSGPPAHPAHFFSWYEASIPALDVKHKESKKGAGTRKYILTGGDWVSVIRFPSLYFPVRTLIHNPRASFFTCLVPFVC